MLVVSILYKLWPAAALAKLCRYPKVFNTGLGQRRILCRGGSANYTSLIVLRVRSIDHRNFRSDVAAAGLQGTDLADQTILELP